MELDFIFEESSLQTSICSNYLVGLCSGPFSVTISKFSCLGAWTFLLQSGPFFVASLQSFHRDRFSTNLSPFRLLTLSYIYY
jgi:hypothetical protein